VFKSSGDIFRASSIEHKLISAEPRVMSTSPIDSSGKRHVPKWPFLLMTGGDFELVLVPDKSLRVVRKIELGVPSRVLSRGVTENKRFLVGVLASVVLLTEVSRPPPGKAGTSSDRADSGSGVRLDKLVPPASSGSGVLVQYPH